MQLFFDNFYETFFIGLSILKQNQNKFRSVILASSLDSCPFQTYSPHYNIILYIGIFIGYHSINFITLMPKAKIYPETQKPRNKKDKEVTSNGSFMKMNASFMPENSSDLLKNYDTCVYCNSLGGNVLHPCACYSSSFHPNCLKNSLKDKIREKEVYIEEKGEYKYIQCQKCGEKIKFKYFKKLRCRNCSDACETLKKNKCHAATFILLILLLAVSFLISVIYGFNIIPGMSPLQGIDKAAVVIGMGTVQVILIFIIMCCFVDCLTDNQIRIDAIYEKKDKGYAYYKRNPRATKTTAHDKDSMVVEEIN